MVKKFFRLIMIALLVLLCFTSCGGGGGGGGTANNPTSTLQVALSWQTERAIPPQTAYFLIEILNPGTDTLAVPQVRIDFQPANPVQASISNVPIGAKIVTAGAFDANDVMIGFGSGNVNVEAGATSSLSLFLTVSPQSWAIVSPYQIRTETLPNPTLERAVTCNLIYAFRQGAGTYTVTTPDSSTFALGDLGPGGGIQALNYTYGSSQVGEAYLKSRGTGSFFEIKSALNNPSGNYLFNANGQTATINYPESSYPEIPLLLSPGSGQTVNWNQPITVNWQDLGTNYVYLVEAFHLVSSLAGNEIADYYWSSADLRTINPNDPRTFSAFIQNLTSSNTVTIPGGIFPANLHNVFLTVKAFPKNLITAISQEARITNPPVGSAVFPWALDQIILNLGQ